MYRVSGKMYYNPYTFTRKHVVHFNGVLRLFSTSDWIKKKIHACVYDARILRSKLIQNDPEKS